MIKPEELQLLADITQLAKYGPESFEALTVSLSNGEVTKTIITVLREISSSLKATQSIVEPRSSIVTEPQTQAPKASKTVRSDIEAIKEKDSERGTLLLRLFDGLQNKIFLPELRDIRIFAEDNGLTPITAKTRKMAINPFVKAFFTMPINKIESFLKLLEDKANIKSDLDSDLEKWDAIIRPKK